jgi:hypothetical protein
VDARHKAGHDDDYFIFCVSFIIQSM